MVFSTCEMDAAKNLQKELLSLIGSHEMKTSLSKIFDILPDDIATPFIQEFIEFMKKPIKREFIYLPPEKAIPMIHHENWVVLCKLLHKYTKGTKYVTALQNTIPK